MLRQIKNCDAVCTQHACRQPECAAPGHVVKADVQPRDGTETATAVERRALVIVGVFSQRQPARQSCSVTAAGGFGQFCCAGDGPARVQRCAGEIASGGKLRHGRAAKRHQRHQQ